MSGKEHTIFELLSPEPNVKYLGSTVGVEVDLSNYVNKFDVKEVRYLGVWKDEKDERVSGRVIPRIMFWLLNTDKYVLNFKPMGQNYYERDLWKYPSHDAVMDVYKQLYDEYRVR